jgi:hypothetical protein
MAKENLKEKEKLQQEKVEERVSAVEMFFNENKKTIWSCLGAIMVIGLLILYYQKFYVQPKRAEGQAQMFPAEASFRANEYDLALNGDGNVLGFAQIAKDYGAKAGKSVFLYAGICELRLGNYENALGYLKKYKGKDKILAARAMACQGDAYVGLEKYNEAISCFEKAAATTDNIFAASYLLKAGVAYEEIGEKDKALAMYKKIKDKYPQSMEGYDIDKYISRIENAPVAE